MTMSENTTTNTKTVEVETNEEHTLFGISYKKIGLGVGAGVAVAAIGATGYFVYKAFAPKAVQAVIDPIMEPVAEAAVSGITNRMF